MLKIAVITPKGQRSEIECTIDTCSIGKSDDNLIVLQGWTVAKKHAQIRRKPDGVYVEDLGSSSGTEVNGDKIQQHGPLQAGDSITIAGYCLMVLDLEADAPAPAAAAPTPVARPAAAAAAPAAEPAAEPVAVPARARSPAAAFAGSGRARRTHQAPQACSSATDQADGSAPHGCQSSERRRATRHHQGAARRYRPQ
jgi:pilus assembly protein CpaF